MCDRAVKTFCWFACRPRLLPAACSASYMPLLVSSMFELYMFELRDCTNSSCVSGCSEYKTSSSFDKLVSFQAISSILVSCFLPKTESFYVQGTLDHAKDEEIIMLTAWPVIVSFDLWRTLFGLPSSCCVCWCVNDRMKFLVHVRVFS